jgi:hypothetical protein
VRRLLLLIALCLFCSAARAQDDYRPSDDFKREDSIRPPAQIEGRSNAALDFYKVWDSIPRSDRIAVSEAADSVKLDEPKKLDAKARQACDDYRAYIDGLLSASQTRDCDWGIRVEAGWMALLPHLGHLRHSARVLKMDACRCLDEKNAGAAAERVAAILRLANQTRSDQIMISSLVGIAITALANQITEQMIKDGQMTPPAARTIIAALKGIDRDDMFGIAESIQREKYFGVDWVRARFHGDHAGLQFMNEVSGMGVSQDFFNNFIYALDEQRLSADLDRFGRYFDAVAVAWTKPDHEVLLRELSMEVWEGQFGLVARLMAPSIEHVARSVDREQAQLARVTAELETIIRTNETPPPAPAKNKGEPAHAPAH